MAEYDYSNITKLFKDRIKSAPKEKLDNLARHILMYWNTLVAQRIPKEHQADYKRCMTVRIGPSHVYIYLDYSKANKDWAVRGLERGQPSFIMNPYILKNAKKRSEKSGKYLDVPMIRSKQEIMDRGGESAMQAVNRLRFAKRWQKKDDDRIKLRPGWASIIHDNVRIVKVGGSTIHVPPHATDPLAGLYKIGKKGSVTYINFRRITENGKPWISKSVAARRLLRKVRNRLDALSREVFDGV